uniref:PD-(D/E)XK nuclease family protein n=1 Tax=Brachyspira catarrhinii TaxID=2528966 RepID=UPI003F4B6918
MNTEIIENTLSTLINEFKKDEEEKYNAISNTIYSIHKSFLDEEELKTNRLNEIFSKIKIIIKEIKEEMKQYPPQFCIFDVVNLQRHENYNSNLFAKFLQINIKYGENTELSFVKDFLMYLHNEFEWDYGLNSIEELEKINHSYIKIKREEYAESRRIDLFISYKKDFAIIIENKIYAGEQDNQLDDYYKNKKKDNYKKLYMIFLTPSGYEPYTLSEESKKELGNNFQTLKHSDIALWLENILENEKYSFLHDSNILFKDNDNKYIRDYRLLKSAMIQTIHNANMISNNTKELDMTKAKIQKLLEENIFKDIQTVEDIEEYKVIFEKVNQLLEEMKINFLKPSIEKHIQFVNILISIINKKISFDDKFNSCNYKLNGIDEKSIINNINKNLLENNYNINFNIFLNNENIVFGWEVDDTKSIFRSILGIYLTELDKNKIENFDKLKQEIENEYVKNNYFLTDYKGWNYFKYIDTEKYNPEEIAEVMIRLYNLLKNNL